jgi:O-antigen/teichoic acid export membrane protein
MLLLVLAFGGLTLNSMTWIIAAAPIAAVAFVCIRFRSGEVGTAELSSESALPYSVGRYALDAWPGVIASLSVARLDQIIGLPLIGSQQLGFYAIAVTVGELPLILGTAARPLLMGSKYSDEGLLYQIRLFRITSVATAVVAAVLMITAPVLIPFVFGKDFQAAVAPTLVLLAGSVVLGVVYQYAGMLQWRGMAALQSRAIVLGTLLGLGLLWVFSPLGALGAALASLVGYVSMLIATAYWGASRADLPITVLWGRASLATQCVLPRSHSAESQLPMHAYSDIAEQELG